jgi:hypothetical protein
MNGKNLNVQYRRNSYAKKRIRVIAAIAAIVIVILVVLFFVIGRVLKNKVDKSKEEDSASDIPAVTAPLGHAELPSVNGYGFSLLGATNQTISDKIGEISSAEGNCINFVVRSASGEEIYSSSVAKNMGKQTASSGYVSVGDISSRAENRGLRVSAILPINAFDVSDDLERSVLLAYDAAICAELYRDGADDVLVSLRGKEVTEENVDELIRLAASVKNIDSEVLIGVSLSRAMLEAEGSEVLVSKLWEAYDFLAYDISEVEEGADVRTYAEESVNSEVHYYLLRYNMRILLPALEGDALTGVVSVLAGKGLSNWQTVVG